MCYIEHLFGIMSLPPHTIASAGDKCDGGFDVGRNAAIKQYDSNPPGQPLELLGTKHARVPVIIELLKSPWIMRASELTRRDGSEATKRAEESVVVSWDPERQYPKAFERDGRRYRIDAIVQVWATDRAWWDPRRRVSRRYWRVLARGGVYDLAYDRETGEWRLVGIQD